MDKRKIFIAVCLLLSGSLIYFSSTKNRQKNDIYSQLAILSNFKKEEVAKSYFLVHFWAKWCVPCAEEIPQLISFANTSYAQWGDKLKILAISLDESLAESKTILPNQGANLPHNFILHHDPQQTLAEKLGTYQYPETYFYDPDGHIVEKWIGPQKWNNAEVIQYFQKVLLSTP